ncbi:phosphoglycerate kinase [Candidatus Saccharibacteria bacterium]|nr:phosphoglycerate kinase [Candidatus Saccharibacteria bacterium]
MSQVVFPKKTLHDIDVVGKTVLLRVDYNVPMTADGQIDDDFRIEASLATINYLLEQQSKVVICSHLGRPSGERDEKFSLKPVAKKLAQALGREVKFVRDCVGPEVRAASSGLVEGEILLLENLRFYAGEEDNERDFAERLAKDSAADFFVQDGFGVVHRKAASTDAIVEFLPSAAGFLVEREWTALKQATDDPGRPLVAVLGGAKISDKIELVSHFIEICDGIIIGGAMANTFLKHLGFDIGDSLFEDGEGETVQKIIDQAQNKFGEEYLAKFILPSDVAISESGDLKAKRREVVLSRDKQLSRATKILDIGEQTIGYATALIGSSRTVIWNGPLGLTEEPAWANGSAKVAEALANDQGIVSVIGGGDTASFIRNWDVQKVDSFSHISTGGGASLELLSGLNLPGVDSLMDR